MYFKYFRNMVANQVNSIENQIDGESTIVEIDKSKFGKIKYHRGHRVEGVWVFEGVKRTPKRRMFLIDVPDRSENTLLFYIQKYVKPGSIIFSDLWRGYYNIEKKLNMLHFTVNHSNSILH